MIEIRSHARRPYATLLLVALIGSCGKSKSSSSDYGPPPVFGAVDTSMACEPGYVGWDFATGGGIEALPKPITIVSLDCDGMGEPKKPADAGQGVKTQCPSATSCNFTEHCDTLQIKFQCGGAGPTLTREFPKGQGSLSCYIKGDGTHGATDDELAKGKACVPKSCPNNTLRDEHLRCVTAPKRNPGWFAFGPPVAVPLQRTSANPSQQRLVGDTEYLFVSSISLGGAQQELYQDYLVGHVSFAGEWHGLVPNMPQGRLEFWFADEYVSDSPPPNAPASVQGFRCTAASAYVSPTSVIDTFLPWVSIPPGGQRWIASRQTISPQCTAAVSADAAQLDAARRAGVSLDTFKASYKLTRLRLHTSFDMEGTNVLPERLASSLPAIPSGCLPQPPGFFYHAGATAKESYIDMIGYYQQRELTAYHIATNGYRGGGDPTVAPWTYFKDIRAPGVFAPDDCGTANGLGAEFGATSAEHPTRIRLSAKNLEVSKSEFEASKYGKQVPRLDLSVSYALAGGENTSNPYGYRFAGTSSAANLAAKRFRAAVYMHPATSDPFDASTAVLIGSVPLADGVASGSTLAGGVAISRRNVRRFFEEWTGIDNFKLFYCIMADGLSPLDPQQLDLPNVTSEADKVQYGAGVDPDDQDGKHRCVAADTVLVVHRDESRRPTNPALASGDLESSADSSAGDSQSQGAQGNGSEKTCSSGVCTMNQHSDMSISGMFGSTILDVNGATVQSSGSKGSEEVDMGGDAEVLGFSVLDLPPKKEGMWADSADTAKTVHNISLSPNWAGIEALLRKVNEGTPIEVETGRYGGRDGLGVGFGYKTMIGPVLANVGVSAGVSLSIEMQIRTEPEHDYPCESSAKDADKCYTLLDEARTQADQLAECAKLGGTLAEARELSDLDDIKGVLSSQTDSRFWVGGQQAYQYVGASCAETPDSTCANNAIMKYRWLSDDSVFASQTGNNALVFASGTPLTTDTTNLVSRLPLEGAVVFDRPAGKLALRDPTEVLLGVCQFDPGTATRYMKFGGGVKLGAAAGLGVSFCTPNDNFGLCLEGSVSFVSIELGYEQFHEDRTIVKAKDGKTIHVGGSGVDVPWTLKILAAEVVAKFVFLIGSVSTTLVSWDGFTVAEGSLFESYNAVIEREP